MWDRLLRHNSSEPSFDDEVKAAATAFNNWATSAASYVGTSKEALTDAIRLLINTPLGSARDNLIDGELRHILGATHLQAVSEMESRAEVVSSQLQLLKETFDSKELVDAHTCVITALWHDARCGSIVSDLEAPDPEGDEEAEWRYLTAIGQARHCCQKVRDQRRLALHEVEMRFAQPKKALERQAAEVAAQQIVLQNELATAVGLASFEETSLSEEAIGLENEIRELEAHALQLRIEMDNVARGLNDARARQEECTRQQEGLHAGLRDAENASLSERNKVRLAVDHGEQQQKFWRGILNAARGARIDLQRVYAETDAVSDSQDAEAVQALQEADSLNFEVADARLRNAIMRAERWRIDDARTTATLELFDAQATEQELPRARERQEILEELNLAWDQRRAAGNIQPDEQNQVEVLRGFLDTDRRAHSICGTEAAGQGALEQEVL